jgi:ABC-2 type transport system ATP-binding protein
MLRIDHIVKHFENLTALNNVSININKGEFFGLLGPNGAGKSTLMNIIIGYLESDSGKILYGDEHVSKNNLALRKKFGYVPQEISLYLELSAYQNLKIFGQLFNLQGKALENKIDEVLLLVQLTDRKKDPVKDFSGGMKRRLNLAASLLHDPEILLCDEPTVGVDPQSRNAIFDMLLQLNKSGKTIVYTTHYMEEAERLCSRLAIIDHGNIIAEGTLIDLINLLNQRDTIKIQKTSATSSKISLIQEIGQLTEYDFYYEVIPNTGFERNSKIFSKLEQIGIPNVFIQISRANLEDVFLNMTGRSLRD